MTQSNSRRRNKVKEEGLFHVESDSALISVHSSCLVQIGLPCIMCNPFLGHKTGLINCYRNHTEKAT